MTISKKMQSILNQLFYLQDISKDIEISKKKYGDNNIYDFTQEYPDISPSKKFYEALIKVAEDKRKGLHAYMPNTGIQYVRKAVADYLTQEQQIEFTENDVVMTYGSSGGFNIIFKTILDPGDEVIVSAPYFPYYSFYVDNHEGKLKSVPSQVDFSLNIDAISSAITKHTKAIIINSPNNPTGKIYSRNALNELKSILLQKSKLMNRSILLIIDETYRKINYENNDVPKYLNLYNNSIIISSYSKDMSVPEERIGFLAVNPKIEQKQNLIYGLSHNNRILGFVNAPSLMQRTFASLQGQSIDIASLKEKRNLLCDGLKDCDYEFILPSGSFYVFPKTPIPDDTKFIKNLQDEKIFALPGNIFGCPGYFRLNFCVKSNTINKAIPIFKKMKEKYNT